MHSRDTRRECCSSKMFLNGSGGPGTQEDDFECKSALFAQKCHLGRKSAPWGPKSPLATRGDGKCIFCSKFAPSAPCPSKTINNPLDQLAFSAWAAQGALFDTKATFCARGVQMGTRGKKCSLGSQEHCDTSFATFCGKVRFCAQGR